MAYSSNSAEAAVSEAKKNDLKHVLTEGCTEANIEAAMSSAQATASPQLEKVLEAFALVAARVRPASYTVASLPSASTFGAGTLVYVSNGAAGQPVLCFSNGSSWLRSDTRTAPTAS